MDKIKKLKSTGMSEDDEKFWSEEVQNLLMILLNKLMNYLRLNRMTF